MRATVNMGFLDFVKSDEKRASTPEEDAVHTLSSGEPGEVEEGGDELHRGMKPRQLSESPGGIDILHMCKKCSVLMQVYRYGKSPWE